mmetsp:Transcript_16998/g.40996  ORF Transcript_16998/g.40996 Transcript_16998/m.40996 type:complete len:226 (+) Transcript_16998:174-851(+)
MMLRSLAVTTAPWIAAFSAAWSSAFIWAICFLAPKSCFESFPTESAAPDAICSDLPGKGSRAGHTASSDKSPYAPRPWWIAILSRAFAAATRSRRIAFVTATAFSALCSCSFSSTRRSTLLARASSASESGHSRHSAVWQSHSFRAAVTPRPREDPFSSVPTSPSSAASLWKSAWFAAGRAVFGAASGSWHTGEQQSMHPAIFMHSTHASGAPSGACSFMLSDAV